MLPLDQQRSALPLGGEEASAGTGENFGPAENVDPPAGRPADQTQNEGCHPTQDQPQAEDLLDPLVDREFVKRATEGNDIQAAIAECAKLRPEDSPVHEWDRKVDKCLKPSYDLYLLQMDRGPEAELAVRKYLEEIRIPQPYRKRDLASSCVFVTMKPDSEAARSRCSDYKYTLILAAVKKINPAEFVEWVKKTKLKECKAEVRRRRKAAKAQKLELTNNSEPAEKRPTPQVTDAFDDAGAPVNEPEDNKADVVSEDDRAPTSPAPESTPAADAQLPSAMPMAVSAPEDRRVEAPPQSRIVITVEAEDGSSESFVHTLAGESSRAVIASADRLHSIHGVGDLLKALAEIASERRRRRVGKPKARKVPPQAQVKAPTKANPSRRTVKRLTTGKPLQIGDGQTSRGPRPIKRNPVK